MKPAALAVLGLVVGLGCVSIRPIERGSMPQLTADEGLLVVHVRNTIPIKTLKISRATVVADLPPGDHFHLIAVRAGNYRWSDIVIPAGEGQVPFQMHHVDMWRFEVRAGRLNYAGSHLIGGRTRARSVDISGRYLNRSGLAVRRIRAEYPGVLERYPPIYTGPERDEYLEHFGRTLLGPENAEDERGAF